MKKFLLAIISILVLGACARVGSPEGGAKDITPPTFIKANMDTSRVNIPITKRELRLDFDEYINLRDINKNLIISPPIKKIKKITPSNLSTKYILIQWDEDLQDNTTYNFNFGNAIVDNNEGNVLPYFNFAFSTGNTIDNLYISGNISDAMLTKEQKTKNNIVIGLYREEADFKQKPHYITKTEEDGYFELNYLSKGKYTLVAFEDENQNSVYDIGKEKVGFLKEPIDLDKNISGIKLKIFPSKKPPKYKETKNINGGILMLFEGNPEKVEVQSISDELKNYKVTHHHKSDSVKIWISNDNQLKKESATSIKLAYSIDNKKDTISTFVKLNEKEGLNLINNNGHLLAPQKDFSINANMDLKEIKPHLWTLKSDSIEQKFEAKISPKSDKILVSSDFKAGKSYTLNIPKQSVSGFFSENDKAYVFKFEIDKPENFGSLTLKLKNTPNSYFWVQLVNKEGIVKYSQYTNSSEIHFTNIEAASYYARILVDNRILPWLV